MYMYLGSFPINKYTLPFILSVPIILILLGLFLFHSLEGKSKKGYEILGEFIKLDIENDNGKYSKEHYIKRYKIYGYLFIVAGLVITFFVLINFNNFIRVYY